MICCLNGSYVNFYVAKIQKSEKTMNATTMIANVINVFILAIIITPYFV